MERRKEAGGILRANEGFGLKQEIDKRVAWMISTNQIRDKKDKNYGAYKDSVETTHPTFFQMAQAMSALLQYYQNEDCHEALESVILCGKWFVRNQVKSNDKHIDGSWYTPEYGNGNFLVIPDIIEALRGLIDLYEITRDQELLATIRKAFACVKKAQVTVNSNCSVSGAGIRSRVWLDYDLKEKKYSATMHRAIDDGIWYRIYRLTKNKMLLEEFKAQCDEQAKYQTKDGGFFETYFAKHHQVIMVAGARWSNYWATMPFFLAYEEFGEDKYLEVIKRSCEWLANRQEKDGEFHSWYYANGDIAHDSIDPNSPAVSITMWTEYMKISGKNDYVKNCQKSLEWLIGHNAELFHSRAFSFSTMAYYSLVSWRKKQLSGKNRP